MKKLLLQLDSDKHPSAFDRIVAYDAGADEVLSYGSVAPSDVAPDVPLMISVTITITSANNNNSFNFADSTLTAEVTKFGEVRPNQNEIPEPSILLLLGAGVAAFGWRSRRRS